MKSIYIIFICLPLISIHLFAFDKASPKVSLTGKITDKKTGDPLPGVTIYLPDLKTGTTTDSEGNYSIQNLPPVSVLFQFSYVSYRTLIEKIDLSVTRVANFEMEYAATEINEVVVTGLSKSSEQKRTPTPITVVPRMVLLQSASLNIIDALSTQPGVAQITTGTGISKPVIRGLGYNRVVVVNDGTRQEGQQWGDEHGIEIDEYSVDKAEILKGPASLAFGSDALAGVINLISAPTQPEGQTAANLTANYQSNNGMIGFSTAIAGNRKGMVWDLRYSHKSSHAYQNRYDGYVLNSGFRENSLSFLIGLTKSWGYSHLKLSAYNMTPGITEGERDSLTGNFIRQIALNDSTEGQQIVPGNALKSYTPITPYQKIHHYKAVLNSNFIIGNSSLKTIFGFQQNQRQEYGNIFNPDQYDLYFLLNTVNYDVRYILPEFRKWSISFGVNGMYQASRNKGNEYLVPEYNLFDFGIFTLTRKSFGDIDISGGLRYDSRLEKGKDLYLNALGEKIETPEEGSLRRFAAFNSIFAGFSGSIGATWQLLRIFFTKFNLSRGFRAPNIGELGSYGIHEGTIRFEIGDPDLIAEKSFQVDFTMGLNSEHISAELDFFSNYIQHYIFSRRLSGNAGGDSLTEEVETFKFVTGNARLQGGEFRIDIHPHPFDWIHFENSISLVSAVQSNQPDSTRYLPMTPAPKLQSALRVDIKEINKNFRNAYIKIELEHFMKQNHYYTAFGTETKTPEYSLVNLGLGMDLTRQDKILCSFYISMNNLADATYQSHLSRLKYSPINYKTGRTGIYNMGRNISFKLIVPINLN
jgi:iron complex outermembrane receptor protein